MSFIKFEQGMTLREFFNQNRNLEALYSVHQDGKQVGSTYLRVKAEYAECKVEKYELDDIFGNLLIDIYIEGVA